MPIKTVISKGRVPVKVWTEDIDPQSRAQLALMAELPFVVSHIAAMPDVHLGIGATVGSVIPTRGAIVPAAVGVDIGCGMNALRLSLAAADLPESLRAVRSAIEAAVPVGFDSHDERHAPRQAGKPLAAGLEHILARHPAIAKMQKHPRETWLCQLGTLGGGNHFIELCLDESQAVWLMLHSGSRGIGNCIGRYFIELAKREQEQAYGRPPHGDLSYFVEGARHFSDYVEAVAWAQDYAYRNRQAMMAAIVEALRPRLPPFTVTAEAINCHHNYVQPETHYGERVYLTRKGAISAREGELGIIPGSMGAKSYIVRGLGNAASFCSCAHGAGRRMSRHEAKRRFKTADLVAQTAGVECRKDAGVIDEIPGAYKDIDEVMANQSDLVEVVHTLKQVLCVKG